MGVGVSSPNLMGQNRPRGGKLWADVRSGRLKDQNSKCAICGCCLVDKGLGHESHRNGSPTTPQLDHDHETGQIRGVLCGRCNSGLGGFKDSPNLLLKAIRYLQIWKKRPVDAWLNARNVEFATNYPPALPDDLQDRLCSLSVLPTPDEYEELLSIKEGQ